MNATDRLNAMQQRCDAATEGPWETWYTMGRATWPIVGRYGVGAIFDSIDHGIRDEDAQFAANARTDLPATIAALRAVLDLHGAVQATWATKTGVGPFPFACEECSDVMWVPHPCPTVSAITEALT